MRVLILFLLISCGDKDFFKVQNEPGSSSQPGGSSIPTVCENHKHVLAIDVSTSNAMDSDPSRKRYKKLLNALEQKELSDNEEFLFVEFSDNNIIINGGKHDNFVSLDEIKKIIERQADRSRDSGFTPYIRTFENIGMLIDVESEDSSSVDKYSVNFFTDGRPCSFDDGCEEFRRFGEVKEEKILDEVKLLKSLENKEKIEKVKIHTVQYGISDYGRSEILNDISEIGEGNSLTLENFDDKSYNEMLAGTSLSCN